MISKFRRVILKAIKVNISVVLVTEYGIFLPRIMIKFCSYDTMKPDADESLKLFHVP